MITTGKLITIEGIDGSGKSTLCKAIFTKLEKKKYSCRLTKEPGGSELGKHLRTILHERTNPLSDKAEYLLFAADRAQHFDRVIQPSLKEGKIIISDRMADSSLAYQGYGRSLDCSMIEAVNHWAMNAIKPDVTIYLKIDINTALNRIKQSRDSLTAFEQEKYLFWQRVTAGFEEIFSKRSNVLTLDARQSTEELATHAIDYLEKNYLKKHGP